MQSNADQRLAQITLFARAIGYRVREDFLDGCGGGLSRIDGKRWIMLDAAQSTAEKTRILLQVLRDDTGARYETVGPQLDEFETTEPRRRAA